MAKVVHRVDICKNRGGKMLRGDDAIIPSAKHKAIAEEVQKKRKRHEATD